MLLNHRYNLFPESKTFRQARTARQEGVRGEECRATRALEAPHRPKTWRAEPSRNFPFLFRIFFRGARKRKIVRENFCEVLAVAIAEAGGARAYDLVSLHHALREWLICFGNRCELGKIETPKELGGSTVPTGRDTARSFPKRSGVPKSGN